MKRVISYSLYGDLKKYTYGAIKNAEDISVFYPGWEGWFYVGKSVPRQIKDKLVLVESVCLYGQDYKLEPDRLIGQRITITSEKIGEKSREPATQCTGKSGPGVVCEEVTVDGKPAIIAGLPGAGITESEVIEATLLASAVQKGEKLIRLDTEYTDCLIWGSVTKLCTDRNIAIDTFKQILSTFKFE